MVEFYFSDVNLATTDQLFRFMSQDPERYELYRAVLGANHTCHNYDIVQETCEESDFGVGYIQDLPMYRLLLCSSKLLRDQLCQVNVPNELRAEMYPHHMEKGSESYHSSSVLGPIYDRVQAFKNLDDVNC